MLLPESSFVKQGESDMAARGGIEDRSPLTLETCALALKEVDTRC